MAYADRKLGNGLVFEDGKLVVKMGMGGKDKKKYKKGKKPPVGMKPSSSY
jgi:hypothetical protein